MKHTSIKIDAEDQSAFVAELALRLHKDIQSAELDDQGRIDGRCQLQGDITRIRRELIKLNHMLEPKDADIHTL